MNNVYYGKGLYGLQMKEIAFHLIFVYEFLILTENIIIKDYSLCYYEYI